MFDTDDFMKSKFIPRTDDVRVEGLKDFFDENEPPLWKVRGQTASEIAQSAEAVKRNINIDSVLQALGSNEDKINELRGALGISTDDVPGEIVKRITQLVQCSVEPVVTEEFAKKLAEARPIEFYIITNKIVELTGMGMEIKKRGKSGSNRE